jgi:hypothetical protein
MTKADSIKVAGARSHTTLRRNTGARRANKIAAAETAGKGYRADLRQVSYRINRLFVCDSVEWGGEDRGKCCGTGW